jgi:hypothetical protein
VVPAVEPEVGERGDEDQRGDARGLRVDEERRDHGSRGEHQGDEVVTIPPGVRVRPVQVRLALPQHDVRDHHQDVRHRRAEDRDVDEQRAVLGDRGEQEADQAGDDQGEVRRLAAPGLDNQRGR